MWGVYDLVHYLCQFLSQRDETSLLSTTKYINDAILFFRYRFSTKRYKTSTPVCGKIKGLIDRVEVRENRICMETLIDVREIRMATTDINVNLSLARSLVKIELPDIHRTPPLSSSVKHMVLRAFKHDSAYHLPKSLETVVFIQSRVDDACDYIPVFIKYPIVFPKMIREICIWCAAPLPSIENLANLVRLQFRMGGEQLPPSFFPAGLQYVKISGNGKTHGVAWPPDLLSLIVDSNIEVDLSALPTTITVLKYPIITRLFPNLTQIFTVSIDDNVLREMDPKIITHLQAHTLSGSMLKFIKKTRVVSLDAPVGGHPTAIPSSVKSLIMFGRSGYSPINYLPNINKISVHSYGFKSSAVIVPVDTSSILITRSGLTSVTFHSKNLKSFTIRDSHIANIDNLPDSVENVSVTTSALSRISRYPKSLRFIDISYNPVVVLAPFTETRVRCIIASRLEKFKGSIIMPATTKKICVVGTYPDRIERVGGGMPKMLGGRPLYPLD